MPAKKIVAADDDDAPVVKKTVKKAIVADDEEATITKKPKKTEDAKHVDPTAASATAAEASSSSAAPAAASRRTAAAAGSIQLTAAVADESDRKWVSPDYDSMTYEQLKKLLMETPFTSAKAQKSVFDTEQINIEADAAKNQIEAFMDGAEGGSQYNTMLQRASTLMRAAGIGDNSRRIDIPPPQMEKIGTKRIAIANFEAICNAIHRSVADVQKYFERQTTASTSLDGNNSLILKMKLDAKGVERIFDKYLSEWITCNVCKSIDTVTEKEKNNRLFVIRCNNCKAFRHAEMTEAAYAANTTKRSKLRSAGLL